MIISGALMYLDKYGKTAKSSNSVLFPLSKGWGTGGDATAAIS